MDLNTSVDYNKKVHNNLRMSPMPVVSFCRIRGVLVSILYGEARINELSVTHKSFMEIPPRSVSIRLLTYFLMFPKYKLRKVG